MEGEHESLGWFCYVDRLTALIPMLSPYSHFEKILPRFSPGGRPNPARDWSILLSLATLALVFIVGWHLWAFETVVSGGVLGRATTPTPPALSQTSIDALRALFANRASEDASYVDGTYRFADPSQ